METNVFEFPIDKERSQLGWVVFSKCSGMRRRVNFIALVEERNRVVRRRTVKRCLEVINKKWSELSHLLHGSRQVSPKMLNVSIQLYVKILIEKKIIEKAQWTNVYTYIKNAGSMQTEAEMIVTMLEVLGVNRKDILWILRWDTITRIIQVADENAYLFIRRVLSLPKYT